MTTQDKLTTITSVGEEVIGSEELKTLLDSGQQLIAYDGFEPSGQMHIAQGLLKAINVNKLTQCGVTFKMLVADWHAMANNKMEGDLKKIHDVGEYFIEIWKASGMDMNNVEFVWASDLVKDASYWELVLRIAQTNSINRFIRTAEIIGREATDELTLAQLIYPAMQTADIFTLNAQIVQLGMDQRKVNMLAREIGPQLGYWKPVVISHHMLLGLGKPPETGLSSTNRAMKMKMSKSNPDSAIFMTDSKEDIDRKLAKAWCPEGEIKENPVLEYCKYIVFEKVDTMTVERPEKFGGSVSYSSYAELERDFADKKLHPMDLKNALANQLDEFLKPIRNHFENDEKAKQLLAKVQSYRVTR